MKFFTSRYTASLEQQVAELKAEIVELKAENHALSALLIERQAESPKLKVAAKDKPEEKKAPMGAVNWLRARSALETQDQVVREAEPDKEKTSNGTR